MKHEGEEELAQSECGGGGNKLLPALFGSDLHWPSPWA